MYGVWSVCLFWSLAKELKTHQNWPTETDMQCQRTHFSWIFSLLSRQRRNDKAYIKRCRSEKAQLDLKEILVHATSALASSMVLKSCFYAISLLRGWCLKSATGKKSILLLPLYVCHLAVLLDAFIIFVFVLVPYVAFVLASMLRAALCSVMLWWHVLVATMSVINHRYESYNKKK